jgi:hypothetical protein
LASFGQPPLQTQSVHARLAHIQHQARRRPGLRRLEVIHRRGKRLDPKPRRGEQAYNVHVLESILATVAPGLGWR